MSIDLARHTKTRLARPLWSGAAFIVEALLLLVFLVASLAVFTQLFAASAQKSVQSTELSQAVAAASNVAERFAADPSSVDTVTWEDACIVVCDRADETYGTGVLHHAVISVYRADGFSRDAADEDVLTQAQDPLYTIETARYESGVKR